LSHTSSGEVADSSKTERERKEGNVKLTDRTQKKLEGKSHKYHEKKKDVLKVGTPNENPRKRDGFVKNL